MPSCAVTFTATVFDPTASAIAPEAEPDETVVPFTVIVAWESLAVGVTVSDATALPTLAV